MTVIETMEQFRSLPVGSEVDLAPVAGRTRRWTKVEGGWRHDDNTIGEHHFEGSVLAGIVTSREVPTAPTPPEVGNTFRSGHGAHYIVLNEPDENGRVRAAAFRAERNRYVGQVTLGQRDWAETLVKIPRRDMPNHEDVVVLVNELIQTRTDSQWREQRIQTLEAAATVPQAVTPDPRLAEVEGHLESLVNAVREQLDNGVEDDALEAALAAVGHGRYASVDVEVEMEGTRIADLPHGEAAELLGSTTMAVDETTVSIRWSLGTSISVTGYPGECVCNKVTREMVEESDDLPANPGEWTFTAECPNH